MIIAVQMVAVLMSFLYFLDMELMEGRLIGISFPFPYLKVIFLFIPAIGFFIAWKWELVGASLVFIACITAAIIKPDVYAGFLWYFLPGLALLFVVSWYASRSLPPAERTIYPRIRRVLAAIHIHPLVPLMMLLGIPAYYCYYYSDEEFLPFLRYPIIKTAFDREGYFLEIYQIDSVSFGYRGPTWHNYSHLYITWGGDTIQHVTNADGFLDLGRHDMRVADTTIASVTGDVLHPHKIGETSLFFTYRDQPDTIPIEVMKKKNGLAIYRKFEYDTMLERDPNAQPARGPRIIRRPKITTPDSLLPLEGRVLVLIDLVINKAGMPYYCQILRSEDERFDDVAKAYATQYRFEKSKKYSDMIIPMVFQNRKQALSDRTMRRR